MVGSRPDRTRASLRAALLGALTAALLAGCGGDDTDPATSGAVDLTRWLPKDAVTYTAIDIAAYKEELDLPEDADVERVSALGVGVLGPFGSLLAKPPALEPSTVPGDGPLRFGAVLNAVDTSAVTSAAASDSSGFTMTVMATSADVGEIGSRLGDLGYRDMGGVLVRGKGQPAIRLMEGLVFASDDPGMLRGIPDEPRDDPPLKLLEELDGADIAVNRIDGRCYSEAGASVHVDGSVELAVLVPGGGEAEGFQPDTGEVGEADADGEVVTKPVIEPADGESARAILARFWPGYECE